MKTKELIVQTGADVMDALNAFLLNLGWEILARNKGDLTKDNGAGAVQILEKDRDDIYAKNAAGQIYCFKIYQKQFIVIVPLNSYKSGAGFYEQDKFNNHISSLGRSYSDKLYVPSIGLKNKDGIDCSGALFCGDKNDLLIRLEFDQGAFLVAGVVNLAKTHEFEGGAIVFSDVSPSFDEYGHNYEFYGYLRGQVKTGNDYTWASSKYPFGAHPFRKDEFGLIMMSLGGKWFYLNMGHESQIVSNLYSLDGYDNPARAPLAPLSTALLLRIGQNRASGLNLMVTPQFFYKNDAGKFVHCGSIENFRVISKHNLRDLAKIDYGAEKFLILAYGTCYMANHDNFTAQISEPAFLAIKLD